MSDQTNTNNNDIDMKNNSDNIQDEHNTNEKSNDTKPEENTDNEK